MRAYVPKQKEEARIRTSWRLMRWRSQSTRRDGGEGGIRIHCHYRLVVFVAICFATSPATC
jgi:hypothetical protein